MSSQRQTVAHLRVLHSEADRLIAVAVAGAARELGRAVSCRRGCAACCHQQVIVAAAEATALVAALRLRGDEATRDVLRRAAAQVEALGEDLDEPEAWKRHPAPCVFLSTDGTCSVYELRPLTCRGYFVFSDPAKCSTARVDIRDVEILHVLKVRPIAEKIEALARPGVHILPVMLLRAAKESHG